LSKQYEEGYIFFNGTVIDLLWLEDIDLGTYGLEKKEIRQELIKSIKWFDNLYLNGEIKSWGITFFNYKSKISIELLELVKELTINSDSFKFIAIRMENLDIDILTKLLKVAKNVVILSTEITLKEVSNINFNNISLLNVYNRNQELIITKGNS